LIEIGVNPVAFTIGTMVVRWYGIIVALAVAALILWMLREVKKTDLSGETILTGSLIALPSGLIVSKLLHVIDLWDYYIRQPGLIFSTAGLTIWGAVLGATLGAWIYSRVRKFDFGHFADAVAPGVILAQVIGRIGCTINGCCYGLPTSLPWGIIYTHPESYGPGDVPVHPTQVYELIYNLIVFATLIKLRGKLKPAGSVYVIYFMLYSAWRLGIGYLREGTPFAFGFQQSQFIAIIILVLTITFLAVKTRWIKKEERERVAVEAEGDSVDDG